MPRAAAGATVLAVDDESMVRMLVADALGELGCSAIEARDAAAPGYPRIRHPIDLMITVVGVPGLNGRQLADAARGMRPELKVLFITGDAESAVIDHRRLEPGMHVLTKPFAMEARGSRVKDVLS